MLHELRVYRCVPGRLPDLKWRRAQGGAQWPPNSIMVEPIAGTSAPSAMIAPAILG